MSPRRSVLLSGGASGWRVGECEGCADTDAEGAAGGFDGVGEAALDADGDAEGRADADRLGLGLFVRDAAAEGACGDAESSPLYGATVPAASGSACFGVASSANRVLANAAVATTTAATAPTVSAATRRLRGLRPAF
ncbi:hypothetical protein, partial [Streptomyces sp. SID1034]|uniref:hypothetical protein n=1 Tax=Streptomyces sp. SID1034 TaxID=2690248 RepID=UPI001F37AA35